MNYPPAQGWIRCPRRSRVRAGNWAVVVLWVSWIAGCGGGDSSGPTNPPPPAPRVSSVVVTPSTGTLLASGATLQFSAAATNNDGSAAGGSTFTWTSSDTEIATVSASGFATASGALGRAVISATTSGITGTATLDVAAGPEGGTFTAFDNTVSEIESCRTCLEARLSGEFHFECCREAKNAVQ